MNKLLKEIRNTNAAARELRDINLTITQLLLLDDLLWDLETSLEI